jgi:hypothetical protein
VEASGTNASSCCLIDLSQLCGDFTGADVLGGVLRLTRKTRCLRPLPVTVPVPTVTPSRAQSEPHQSVESRPSSTVNRHRHEPIAPKRSLARLVPNPGANEADRCAALWTRARADGRVDQHVIGKLLKVLATTLRTSIVVRRTTWSVQPVPNSHAHDLPTIETDTRLHLNPVETEASEQLGLMAAPKALGLKEDTHQPIPRQVRPLANATAWEAPRPRR